MPRLLVSHKALDGGIGVETKLWRFRATEPETQMLASEPVQIPLPSGTSGVNLRPSWANYNLLSRSRKYGSGAWTSNILVDENGRCLRQGIPAPTIVPSVASAAGPGVTTASVCYLRFVDTIAERAGPLSAASTTVNLANQSRAWTSLPTTCPDPSVNAIEGVVANDGALPRVTWRRDLGVTSVTEAIANGALGEAVDEFTEMPLCQFNAVWHDALWGSGNEQYPERVFKSAIQELERYEGLYLQSDGEPVVGMFGANENFFFGSKKTIYRASGFTELDITRDIEKPDIGLVNHHGIAQVHGRVIVPSTVGFLLYDGGWRNLTRDRASEWQREYNRYRAYYEAAQGFFDPVENVYTFGPVPHSEILATEFQPYTYWVIDAKRLIPEVATSSELAACISNDARARSDAGKAAFYLPGSSRAQVVLGSCDGTLREENVRTDGSDDDDLYAKQFTIEPATELPDPGGSFGVDAVVWHRAWNFLRSREREFTIEFRAGTENVTDSLVKMTETVGIANVGTSEESPDMVDTPLEGMSGAALCMRIIGTGFLTPLDTEIPSSEADSFSWSGWGGTNGPGLRVAAGLPTGDGG